MSEENNTTCSNTCTGSCSISCTGDCNNTCTGGCSTCADHCSTGCTTTCTGTCEGCTSCSGGCTGCSGSCDDTCTGGCTGDCTSSCEGTCSGSCDDTCTGTCTGTCEDTCTGSCSNTCVSNCASMTVERAKELLLRIKKEIYRRSGMDENGNWLLSETLRHFNLPILSGPDDSLFELGYTDDVIRALNGAPIINTLIDIGDYKDLRTVNEYDPIPQAFDIEAIEALLTKMEAEPYDSDHTTCRSACTGLCISNCTSTCVGGCENSCSTCSEQCSGMCSDTCTGCSVTCGTNCGVSCGSSCSSDSSACAGCSSGCVSCTGCAETCTSSCAGCNSTCYTECTGGASSYSTDASCNGSSCSTNCGGKASAIPSRKTTYGINLHHDGRIYGIMKTDLKGNSTLTLPAFSSDKFNPFRFYDWKNADDSTVSKDDVYEYWIDEDDNKFSAGSLIYYAATETAYNNNLALGRKTTKCTDLYSVQPIYWASCTKYYISSDVSTTTDILSIGSKYIVDKTTNIFISATKNGNSVTGLSTEWQVKINGTTVELPYSGVAIQGDVIEVFGDNTITYKLRRTQLLRKSAKLSFPRVRVSSDIQFRCWCTEYFAKYDLENDDVVFEKGTRKECSFDENENAKYSKSYAYTNDGAMLFASMEVESHLVLGADGKYHGFLYEIEAEYYTIPESYTYDRILGSESLIGKVRLVDTDGITVLRDINLTEYRNFNATVYEGSYYVYQFTIPNDLDSDITGFIGMNSDINSKNIITFTPGNSYAIFNNQCIVLKAIRGDING